MLQTSLIYLSSSKKEGWHAFAQENTTQGVPVYQPISSNNQEKNAISIPGLENIKIIINTLDLKQVRTEKNSKINEVLRWAKHRNSWYSTTKTDEKLIPHYKNLSFLHRFVSLSDAIHNLGVGQGWLWTFRLDSQCIFSQWPVAIHNFLVWPKFDFQDFWYGHQIFAVGPGQLDILKEDHKILVQTTDRCGRAAKFFGWAKGCFRISLQLLIGPRDNDITVLGDKSEVFGATFSGHRQIFLAVRHITPSH